MKYGQLYLDLDSLNDKALRLRHRPIDNIDRVEKKDYTATPFIWSYPETLSFEEAKQQFIIATAKEITLEIEKSTNLLKEVLSLRKDKQ